MGLESAESIDVRSVAAYDLVDASRYVRVPKSTLRAWFSGQRGFAAVLEPADAKPTMLSFFNLVEAHVLNAIRREHEVALQRVRIALSVLHERYPTSKHPLIEKSFSTDGVDLFLDGISGLENISSPQRQVLKNVLEAHVRRIEWNPEGLPDRLYPFAAASFDDRERRNIVIDPRIAFGRRVISGTGIRTEIVAERYAAGESIEELALDYARTHDEIEDAIRSEFSIAA
jgi:uncharacterized protein (DUF433 family)